MLLQTCRILRIQVGINSKLKGKTQNSRKKLKTQGKNSKLKKKLKTQGKTQVFGIFICWAWGKGGQTISLI